MSDLRDRLHRVFGLSRDCMDAAAGAWEDCRAMRAMLLEMAVVAEYGRSGATLLSVGFTPGEVDDLASRPGSAWDGALRVAMRVQVLETAHDLSHDSAAEAPAAALPVPEAWPNDNPEEAVPEADGAGGADPGPEEDVPEADDDLGSWAGSDEGVPEAEDDAGSWATLDDDDHGWVVDPQAEPDAPDPVPKVDPGECAAAPGSCDDFDM